MIPHPPSGVGGVVLLIFLSPSAAPSFLAGSQRPFSCISLTLEYRQRSLVVLLRCTGYTVGRPQKPPLLLAFATHGENRSDGAYRSRRGVRQVPTGSGRDARICFNVLLVAELAPANATFGGRHCSMPAIREELDCICR